MTTPAISVLLPVRNGERFLDATLRSLSAQTFDDFEIILLDNASTDGTAALIKDWAVRDARVKPFFSDARALGRCLNIAARMASAPLLARLDSDDIAAPERLAIQHARMAEEPRLGLLGSSVRLIDAASAVIGVRQPVQSDEEIRRILPRSNPFVHSSVIIRRGAFDAVGGYRDGLMICEDYDLWLRLSAVSRMENLPEMLVDYRIHDGAMTSGRQVRMALADACIAAAATARLRGGEEPFDKGRPMLRRALAITGQSRWDFRDRMLKAAVAAARAAQGQKAAGALRRRALRLFLGLKPKHMPAGLGRVIAMYSGKRR